jgi:hypothetical protein
MPLEVQFLTCPLTFTSRPPVVGRTSILSPIIDEDLEIDMLPLEELGESTNPSIPLKYSII